MIYWNTEILKYCFLSRASQHHYPIVSTLSLVYLFSWIFLCLAGPTELAGLWLGAARFGRAQLQGHESYGWWLGCVWGKDQKSKHKGFTSYTAWRVIVVGQALSFTTCSLVTVRSQEIEVRYHKRDQINMKQLTDIFIIIIYNQSLNCVV